MSITLGIYGNIIQSKKNHFYFYHLLPKDADLSIGIISLEYQYKYDKEMFLDNSSKYRYRLVGPWNIYPDRDPDTLSAKEIADGIRKFREDPKNGLNRIYLFRYPPYINLGPRMKQMLNDKVLVQVDLNDLRKHLIDIDYGFNGSDNRNKRLNENWYRNISIHEYFENYTERGNQPLFASLNHISVAPKSFRISPRYIMQVPIPQTENDIIALEGRL